MSEEKQNKVKSQPIKIRRILTRCPECDESEEFYFDPDNNAYYCGKCQKIFTEEED